MNPPAGMGPAGGSLVSGAADAVTVTGYLVAAPKALSA